MKNVSTILADVVAHEHANLDSFPFRYGFTYPRTTQIELFNCRNHKWQIEDIRFEVDADFVTPEGNRETGHFIVMFTQYKNPKVVTVWKNDQESEFFISKLLTSMRKKGKISTRQLIDMNPLYKAGEANTFEDLARIIAAREFEPAKKLELERLGRIAKSEARLEFRKLVSQLETEKKRAEEAVSQLKVVVDNERQQRERVESENEALAKKLGIKEGELKSYISELNKMRRTRSGHNLNLDEGAVLVAVNRGVIHRGSKCTELVFSNGVRKYMKISTFDRDLSVTAKAQKLIGEVVKTTSWDPVREPGKWSRQGYFMNVYQA